MGWTICTVRPSKQPTYSYVSVTLIFDCLLLSTLGEQKTCRKSASTSSWVLLGWLSWIGYAHIHSNQFQRPLHIGKVIHIWQLLHLPKIAGVINELLSSLSSFAIAFAPFLFPTRSLLGFSLLSSWTALRRVLSWQVLSSLSLLLIWLRFKIVP